MSFNIGDIVQLKSGGPNMTIQTLEKSGEHTGDFLCVWFNKHYAQELSAHFPECVLKTPDQATSAGSCSG